MEDGFKKLKDELKDELTKSLEKSLTTTNDGTKDLRSWVRWIVGTFDVGVRCQWILLHNSRLTTRLDYVENRFLRPLHGGKVGDKDQRFGDEAYTMIQNAITQLKLEFKIEYQERLLSDQN